MAFCLSFFAARAANIAGYMTWLSIAWGLVTACVFLVSLRAKSPLVSSQLILFFLLFLFLMLGSAFAMPTAIKIAAIAGVVCAIVAGYESFSVTWLTTSGEAPSLTRPAGPIPKHIPSK